MGEQGWRSGESARLPPMCPGSDSRTRRHRWVEFVVGSLPCPERFFSGYSGFPLSSETNISKFQFHLDYCQALYHEPALARVIAQALPVFDIKFTFTNIFLIYIGSYRNTSGSLGDWKMLCKSKSLANVSSAFRRRRQCKCKKCKHGIYIALLSWSSKSFTTLCGGLCQTAYLGANCSHAAHNLIKENSRVPRCPQNGTSGKPSHRGLRPLLFSNSVWIL